MKREKEEGVGEEKEKGKEEKKRKKYRNMVSVEACTLATNLCIRIVMCLNSLGNRKIMMF